ncbi:MAG TPA: HEAT repeat domain-containing protein [Planctomycetota bacterium]|nr:HEAT repeat domain-containing protein [Planctomycetota bacterium]
MVAMKSAAAILLAALVLIITPTFVHQDAGPGKPDDVAQLLPEETLAFVELVKAPRLLGDWKEYVGSVTTPGGKEKLCASIEEWFTKTLEIVPEKLLKDLKAGLPTIQRMAVALTGVPNPDVPWIFIATTSDPAFFKKLVEEDLAVFAAEEKAHAGVKVFAIRKMGDLKTDEPVFVAVTGSRLVVTTRWASLTDALDRAAGRAPGGDLRKNRLYAQLAPAPSDDPALRAFSRWNWDGLIAGSQGPSSMYRRMMWHGMDQADSVFGFRKMVGATVEATFKPGQVASILRLVVDSPCRLYDALRQPAGPKDLLAHLPKKTVLFAHGNLKDGKEVWSDIEAFIRRYQEAERKGHGGREGEDYVAVLDREAKEELGFTPREAAAIFGNEILFAMVAPGEDPDFEKTFLVMGRTTDSAKAKELLEKATAKLGGYTASTEDKVTIFKSSSEHTPSFGIRDTVVALGHETLLKEALGSKDDAAGALKRLPKEAATASGVMGVNPAGMADLILKLSGTEKPDDLKHLRSDDWSILLSRTEKDQAVMTVTDSGVGSMFQTTIAMLPLVAVAGFRTVAMAVGGMPDDAHAPPAPKALPEPAALPAAELAKRTTELVALLRSDDLVVREKASGDLRSLGRQAIPQLVAAYKSEKDPEAKSRLTSLLVDHRAWDALPELLDRKADAFFDEFRAAVEQEKSEDDWWGGYATWNNPESGEPYCMEPYVQSAFLDRMKNAEVASIPAGLKRFAERLQKSDIAAPKRAQFAAVLAFNNCGPAFETVLEMRDAATDAESRAYLTAALGWSDTPKAKEAVYKSLEAKATEVRRGAFLAAERMRDPEVVARLLDRTKDADFETRWNAGYTVGIITSGKVTMNAFLPDAEFEQQVKDARDWLEKNKDSIRSKK